MPGTSTITTRRWQTSPVTRWQYERTSVVRSIRYSFLWLVGVVVVMAGGCQARPDASDLAPRSSATSMPVVAHSAWVHHFTKLADLVEAADAVVVGRIIGEGRGPITGPEGEQIQDRLLYLAVEERLAGSLPRSVVIPAEQGWLLLPEGERPFVVDGTQRLSPGDRGLFAVVKRQAGPYYRIINDQGAFLFADGRVVRSALLH
jgi:hypothetical protein